MGTISFGNPEFSLFIEAKDECKRYEVHSIDGYILALLQAGDSI